MPTLFAFLSYATAIDLFILNISFFAKIDHAIRASMFAIATAALNVPNLFFIFNAHISNADSLFGIPSSFFLRHCIQVIIDLAPSINKVLKPLLPRFVIPRSRCLPPDECSFGVIPIYAAICRPFLKCFASLTCETRAVAFKGPILE